MKAIPFERVKQGQVFRDIDGTTLMRTTKSYSDVEGQNLVNCVVLISNKPESISRGDMIAKGRDIYCEALNDREVSELKLIEMSSEEPITPEE